MIVTARRAAVLLGALLRARDDRRPVLMPANVCPVVAETLAAIGRPYELVDIEEDLGIDRRECLRRLRARPGEYGALLFVRAYGDATPVGSFFLQLKQSCPDLTILDDRCLCAPEPDPAGLEPGADAALWSTGARKALDLGGGGYARFDVDWFGELAPRLAEVEARIPVDPAAAGGPRHWAGGSPPWNRYRDRIRSALPRALHHKRALDRAYAQGIPAGHQLPARFRAWRFHLRVPQPDALVGALFAAGLFASRHYPPLHAAPVGAFPRCEALHAEVVNLFNDGHMDVARARRACEVVRTHLRVG